MKNEEPHSSSPEESPYPHYDRNQIKSWPVGMIMGVLFGKEAVTNKDWKEIETFFTSFHNGKVPKSPKGLDLKNRELPKSLYEILNGRYVQSLGLDSEGKRKLRYIGPVINDPKCGIHNQINHEINELKNMVFIALSSFDGLDKDDYNPKTGALERKEDQEKLHLEPAHANEFSELRMPFYGAMVPAPHRLTHSILEGPDANVTSIYKSATNTGGHPTLMNETYIYYNQPQIPLRNQQVSMNSIYGGAKTAKGLHYKAVQTLRRFQEIAPLIENLKGKAESEGAGSTPGTNVNEAVLANFVKSISDHRQFA